MTTKLTVSADWMARVTSAAALVLGALSLAAHPIGLTLFQLDAEANVPSWYTSLLLLLCAATLGVIGQGKRVARAPHARHWGALALLFSFLSLDEIARFHDKLNYLLSITFQPSGFLYFPWVVPAALLVMGLAVAYARWLLELPGWVRARFLVAAFLYVGGAVGLETLSAGYSAVHGLESWGYVLLSHCEELLEMLGLAVFLPTLIRYAGTLQLDVRLEVAESTNARVLATKAAPVDA